MNNHIKENACADTVKTGESWKRISEYDRKDLVRKQLQLYKGAESFKVIKADDNGQIIISIQRNIPANERGLYLLELEQTLKNNLDQGLHLWCEPVGDKSKLRKLRGVKIKA